MFGQCGGKRTHKRHHKKRAGTKKHGGKKGGKKHGGKKGGMSCRKSRGGKKGGKKAGKSLKGGSFGAMLKTAAAPAALLLANTVAHPRSKKNGKK